MRGWRAAAVVFAKELVDALRDRRTLATVLVSSVAVGPLVLLLLSVLVGDVERRAEAREMVAVGIAEAPTLRNFVERQGYVVREAPADWPAALAASRLAEPVVVVPAGFEAALVRGEPPLLEVVAHAANPRSQGGAGRIQRLLEGFNREQATLRLALRGVAPGLLEAVEVQPRDLADPAARASQFTTLLPFFVLMAVLYGALNAALDTTAGERERGSLEPLLANPVPRAALVLGKWAAVTAVAVLIAVLSAASFIPAQALLASETLAALIRYGPGEALWFVALLVPLAGALAALLMAIAIRSRSVKEAQAGATVVVLAVSLLPLATLFNQAGETVWHRFVPGLAQIALMGRVLKGDAPGLVQTLPALAACAALATAGLVVVARTLRRAALD